MHNKTLKAVLQRAADFESLSTLRSASLESKRERERALWTEIHKGRINAKPREI